MLKKVIDEVVLYLNATEEFVTEQAPLLAQEMIRYGIWWNLIILEYTFNYYYYNRIRNF